MNPNRVYDMRLKPRKRFFDNCIDEFTGYIFENSKVRYETFNRNASRTRTVFWKKNIKLSRYSDNKAFAILMATQKRIEFQLYEIHQSINQETMTEGFDIKLINMERWDSDGRHYKITRNWFNNQYCNGLRQISGMMSGYYTNAYLYDVDYECVRKINVLKDLNDLPRLLSSTIYGSDITSYISKAFKYSSGIRFLQKLGATTLINEIYKGQADMRKVTNKWVLKNRRELREFNPTFKEMEIIEYLKDRDTPVIKKSLRFLDIYYLKRVPEYVDLYRTQKYLSKQNKHLSYYLDYLNTLEELKVPATERIEFFPRCLQTAHDRSVGALNLIKKETDEKAAAKAIIKSFKYEYQGEVFSVVAPKLLQDIVNEGKALSHCVGGNLYLNDHKKGERYILFCRYTKDIDKSLVTLTLDPKNKNIVSIHAYGNYDDGDDMTREHFLAAKDFLNKEWLPWVQKGCKKRKEKINDPIQNIETSGRNIPAYQILNQSSPTLK